jgi:hypothetical protein
MSLQIYNQDETPDWQKSGYGLLSIGSQEASNGRPLDFFKKIDGSTTIISFYAVQINGGGQNLKSTKLRNELIQVSGSNFVCTGLSNYGELLPLGLHYFEFTTSDNVYKSSLFCNVESQDIRDLFTSEYETVYDSWTNKPNDDVALVQNDMVEKLINDGIWSKLDVFYVLAAHTNDDSEAFTNWINPGLFDINELSPPTFVAFEGFTESGSAGQKLDTSWQAAFPGNNYVQNSASYGIYIRTDVDETEPDMGELDSSSIAGIITRNSNILSASINESSMQTVANTDSKGLYIVNRDSSVTNQIYKNKSLISSPNTASTGLPGQSFWVCNAYRSPPFAAVPTTKQTSMAFTGGSLGQTDVNNLTDAFETYMDYNGKGIIT